MKKINRIIPPILILLILCAAASVIMVLNNKMNSSIEENGKKSMEAVMEQIQQTYELQVEGFYSRLRVIDGYVAQGDTKLLDNADIKNFLESWQKETGAPLFFIKENGAAITVDKEERKLEITSTLLMALKANHNIAKLISYQDGETAKTGFLMAIPCQEYYIDGEAYTAIGAIVERSNMDSILKLYAYGDEGFLFMLDADGDVIYTNQQDEKLFQNYSLLKHLERENSLTNEERTFLENEFSEGNQGIELLGGNKAYYLGYRPIAGDNSTLVCIVPERVVDNTMKTYQKTVMYAMLIMAIVVILLFVGLFFSLSRISIANQKTEYEKRIKKQQEQNIKKLQGLNKGLEEAQQATTEALQAAEVANRAKTDFLSNMSHDIRTPMNAIVGITALIEHDAYDEEKVREYAKKIEISSQNLLGIINDVLDMNKIEAGKITFTCTDFSIYSFVREIDVLFRPQAEEKHQTFEIVTENIRHEWLNADSVRLTQIIGNLLSNAVKYTQEGGKICFCTEEYLTKSQTYARFKFTVKDNGMGIDEDFQDRIFDAFTRQESSLTNKIQGTGLGLAITRNLVELMGGSITVESKKDEGSCFEILMDIKISEGRAVSEEHAKQKEEEALDALKGMKFLCAEDNELNAEIMKELLKMEGAECTICTDGKKVLKAFEQSKPGDYDAILMDVQMPVMNGCEAARAIRNSSHELAKSMPIIAMTANAFSEDIQLSLASGMNAHVSKPIDIKEMAKTIRNVKFKQSNPANESKEEKNEKQR